MLGRKFIFFALRCQRKSEVIGDKLVGRVIDEPGRRPGTHLSSTRGMKLDGIAAR